MIQLQFVVPVLLQGKSASQGESCSAFCGVNKWN